MTLSTIDPFELQDNVFTRIGRQWMLVAAAKPDGSSNAMTAAWGGLGFIWQKPVAFVFVRQSRCTKTFIEASERLSLSFLASEYRDALQFMGNVSGFDDPQKIEHSGLELAFLDGVPYFPESELVLICKRLYQQDMEERCFLSTDDLVKWYDRCGGIGDLHTLYIAEIEQILVEQVPADF